MDIDLVSLVILNMQKNVLIVLCCTFCPFVNFFFTLPN